MNAAWYGLLLSCESWPFYGASYVVTGKADLVDGKISKGNIREFTEYDKIVRPFYEHCSMDYIKTFRGRDDSWLISWKENYALLEHGYRSARRVTAIISDALESFKDAKTHHNVGTAIARYVEAAEAVLAMPRSNSGRSEFSRRAFAILNPAETDPYLKWGNDELQARLLKLYDLRNARNHGKGLRDSVTEVLELSDPQEIDSCMGKLSYLAELLARKSILSLLRHREASELIQSRLNLENAWRDKRFP